MLTSFNLILARISLKIGDFVLKKLAHLLDDVFLDLAHPFAGDAVSIADFLQCHRVVRKNAQVKVTGAEKLPERMAIAFEDTFGIRMNGSLKQACTWRLTMDGAAIGGEKTSFSRSLSSARMRL